MGMKETPGSMRVYLILAGLFGLYSNWANLALPGNRLQIVAVSGLIVSAGFVYCGVRLTHLLETGANLVSYVLYAALFLSLGQCLLFVLYSSRVSDLTAVYVSTAITVAIVLYLLVNLKRLRRD